MSKSEFIKFSGWAFIAGAFAFATILTNSDAIQIPGSTISALLLAAGMLSLRAAHSDAISRFSRNILLIGAVGTILWNIILAYLITRSISGTLHVTEAQGQRFWIVAFGAPAVALLALTLFGLASFRSESISRLKGRPILAGIWYPIVYCFLFVYLISHNGVLPSQYWPLAKVTFAVQFFALFMLGVVFITEAPQELATA